MNTAEQDKRSIHTVQPHSPGETSEWPTTIPNDDTSPTDTTPLLVGARPFKSPVIPAFGSGQSFVKIVEGASKMAASNLRGLAVSQYTKFKNDPKRGPVCLKWLSYLACAFILPAVTIDFFAKALTLSPMEALVNVYAALGVCLVFLAEIARVSTRFNIRAILHFYFGFAEFCVGLGTIQLFVASLVLSDTMLDLFALFKLIPAVVLLICGICNIIWGVYAAYKLNLFLKKLKDDSIEEGISAAIPSFTEKTIPEKLDLLDRKFEALNKRGDGQLTKDDLREGISELNLAIDEVELNIIFETIDVDKNGYISKQEFETWWMTEKGISFL
ncbi:EF hand domain-containing protein [Cardiosporidium cionae]|uniref:EF hand domain-containing protein n=1 Tax=Cardiosporidium cionae TaxID=476202 RepID=A0ABQ7J8S2_9APIC|nr:EF hand domain-containing protein [Cardiosporidium cionae]|eukprot:KAF8820060.1 EF hand domain-containing protein [Cardiosporidium cionae]